MSNLRDVNKMCFSDDSDFDDDAAMNYDKWTNKARKKIERENESRQKRKKHSSKLPTVSTSSISSTQPSFRSRRKRKKHSATSKLPTVVSTSSISSTQPISSSSAGGFNTIDLSHPILTWKSSAQKTDAPVQTPAAGPSAPAPASAPAFPMEDSTSIAGVSVPVSPAGVVAAVVGGTAVQNHSIVITNDGSPRPMIIHTSYADFFAAVTEHEISTVSKYNFKNRHPGFDIDTGILQQYLKNVKTEKDITLFWKHEYKDEPLPIPFSGTPFLIMNKREFWCHQGKDKDVKLKTVRKAKRREEAAGNVPSEHQTGYKSRRLIQPSKKLDCPASFVAKKVVYFPGKFKATETNCHEKVEE